MNASNHSCWRTPWGFQWEIFPPRSSLTVATLTSAIYIQLISPSLNTKYYQIYTTLGDAMDMSLTKETPRATAVFSPFQRNTNQKK